MQTLDGMTGHNGQPLNLIEAAAELDAADAAEREALTAHDIARARLRAARSVYRRLARAERIGDTPKLPATDSAAEAAIMDTTEKLARLRKLYDGLVALGESDRSIIDAGVEIERARLDLEDLSSAYAERQSVPCV
jgi:hypothetical protein